MKSVERRLRALESLEEPERQPEGEFGRELARGSKMFVALAVYHCLREGGEARKELDAADDSLDPERRAELTEQIEAARKITTALEKYSTANETSPSAGFLFPGRLGGTLGALRADGSKAPVPARLPADPSLPKHAYIYIEEGERERSGTRAWLAMEGPHMILNTLHGADARRLAREWVETTYKALPAEEIEVLLPEDDPPTE